MSVLIKMEMPKSCRECCLCDFDSNGYYCIKLEKVLDKWHVRTQRDCDCPLVEVPPHGRLIDADEFVENLTNSADNVWNLLSPATQQAIRRVCDDIKKYPTIIGAEGSEE